MRLTGSLILSELAAGKLSAVYQDVKTIDLQQLINIDSAGLAYLVQIKTNNPGLSFIGVPEKITILADLYGVSFLFK
ncbi:STAS domain-containing protein [Psychromonas aquimarina]|uniref:STAS domain-containing protein n=1 Tax=Psychromonas aquimarina TaxID=444919 RepID=UPI0004061FF5|nr:hypothetical protein [Psychromonas aquimarina]